MRLVVNRVSLRSIPRWTRFALLAGAVSIFCYLGFMFADAWIFENRESRHLDSLLHYTDRASGRTSIAAGRAGNIGISAHRDTFFRPLRNIRQNDMITLTTLTGEFHYRVVSTRVVHPNNLAVLDQNEKEILTLVNCYPFYFVGSAPERFIVRAERVGKIS